MKAFFKSLGLGMLGAVLVYGAAQIVVPVVRASVSCSVPFVFSNGSVADATQVNANFNSLVACFGNTAESGVNASITALTGLTTPLNPVQGGTTIYQGGNASGTNTITLGNPSPAGFQYVAGNTIVFFAQATNTGPTTLNVNSLGQKNLFRQNWGGPTATVGGELIGGAVVQAVYDGTQFVLVTNYNPFPAGAILDFGGSFGCPVNGGWAEANGQAISATTWGGINFLYGTAWGTSAGNTVMPDLRGTATYGRDSGGSGRLTVASNFPGNSGTVGAVNYAGAGSSLETRTLAQVNLPSGITLTGSATGFSVTGSSTPTVSGTQALSLHGSHGFQASAASTNYPTSTSSWTDTLVNFGANGHFPQTSSLGSVSASSYQPTTNVDLTNAAYSVDSVAFSNASFTVNGSSFGINNANPFNYTPSVSLGGSGSAFGVTSNAAIVTKCVKL